MKVLFCDDKRQQVQFAGALTFLATNWFLVISKLLFSYCIIIFLWGWGVVSEYACSI